MAADAGTGQCCCNELRLIHDEKELTLIKISDAWKNKTYTLANQFYTNLHGLRQENNQLRATTFDAVDKMREYQHQVVEQILRKQEEMVLNYERKLKSRDKENK